jgi:hypothetical protein
MLIKLGASWGLNLFQHFQDCKIAAADELAKNVLTYVHTFLDQWLVQNIARPSQAKVKLSSDNVSFDPA